VETTQSLLFVGTLGLALVLGSSFLHYEVLRNITTLLPRLTMIPRRMRALVAILGGMASHFGQVSLFALAYFMTAGPSGGELAGDTASRTFFDFVYFSTETYTSLGVGDIYAVGPLRLLVGVESITGLLMIGWTTSFTYLEMRRHWDASPGPS
jgi:hypothetical protein